MVHGVILGTHNWLPVTPHGIMDVGSPNTAKKEREKMLKRLKRERQRGREDRLT